MPRTLVKILRLVFPPFYTLDGPDRYPQFKFIRVTYDAPNLTEDQLTTLDYEQHLEDTTS